MLMTLNQGVTHYQGTATLIEATEILCELQEKKNNYVP